MGHRFVREGQATSARSAPRSEEHTSELQSQSNLVCRLLLEKKKKNHTNQPVHHSDSTDITLRSIIIVRAAGHDASYDLYSISLDMDISVTDAVGSLHPSYMP